MRDHWTGEKYPKTVPTIYVPFTGDPELFKVCPNESSCNFPRGIVANGNLEFDEIIWDSEDEIIKKINDKITHIEAKAFDHLPVLESVNFRRNQLTTFVPHTFTVTPLLKQLWLQLYHYEMTSQKLNAYSNTHRG